MTHWLLIALIAILFLVVLLCVKSSMDREEDEVVDEVADGTIEEVVDCSYLTMSTRKNCLIARDGVAYEF